MTEQLHRRLTPTQIAECIWRAEYRRATGKERSVPFSEISGQDQAKYLYVADAIIALSGTQS